MQCKPSILIAVGVFAAVVLPSFFYLIQELPLPQPNQAGEKGTVENVFLDQTTHAPWGADEDSAIHLPSTQEFPPDRIGDSAKSERLRAIEPAVVTSDGFRVQSQIGSSSAIEISVPKGARLPVALLQPNLLGLQHNLLETADGPESAGNERDEPTAPILSATQQKLGERLVTDFAKEVAQNEAATPSVPGSGRAESPGTDGLNRWEEAVAKADGRFLTLFGYDAYNRETMRQRRLNEVKAVR